MKNQNDNEELKIHDVYSFDTEFEMKKTTETTVKNKPKLKPLSMKNMKRENKTYLPLMVLVAIISIVNLMFVNISSAILGFLEVFIIYIFATQIEFGYDDNSNYYVYNITTLTKAFLKNTILGSRLINKAELILDISILIFGLQQLTLSMFSVCGSLSSLLQSVSEYGLLIGFILCFINQNTSHVGKIGKAFYIIQMIMIVKEGFLNILIYNNPTLSHERVVTILLVLTLTLLIKQCDIYDFRESEKDVK